MKTAILKLYIFFNFTGMKCVIHFVLTVKQIVRLNFI
jgi:hypothetical protein